MMGRPRNALSILLIAAAILLAFLAGTVTVAGSSPTAIHALTPGQWAAVQASNALLLDEGPTSTYLPLVLR
jgi:hypothetical protein